MVMYQMSADKLADGQQRQNGLPVSMPPEYSAAKSLHQLGVSQTTSPVRIEQLEAEVQRLRSALAEKTIEAQKLQQELQAALQIIDEHQSSQQQRQSSEVDTPANEEETTTAASSQD